MGFRSAVVVSAVNPYPTDAGKKIVLAGFVDYLRERLGADQVTYVLVRPESEAVPDFPVPLRRLASPRTRAQLTALATRVPTGRSSIQEAMLRDEVLRGGLAAVLGELQADLEIFDTVRLGQYAAAIPRRAGQRRVIYLDDLFSVRYRAMLDAARRHRDVNYDPLGAFGPMIPGPLRRPTSWRPVQRAVLGVESRLVRRSERASVRQFDQCLLVNEGEAALLRAWTGAGNVTAVPPLLPPVVPVERTYDGRPEFVFLGLLSLPHNDDGIRAFLAKAMPGLLARVPDARLRIVGREARDGLVSAAARFPDNVTLEGFVADLDDLFAGACTLLNPLRFGSGVKLKVLEALSRGVPVASTPVGADGIVDGPGQGVVVVPDVDHYPAALQDLVDGTANAQVSEQGRRHFAARFSRDAVFAAYDEAFAG